jgi:copper(I)-binding protein
MHTRIFARFAAALILASSVPVSGFAHRDNPAEHAAEEGGSDDHQFEDYSVGRIIIETPWSRATPPTANVAAGYLTIRNDGDATERFVSASSPSAQRVEIHTMDMVHDVMQMRHLSEGLEIPAGEEVALAPGGYHLMLIGLDAPLAEGDRVPVTLEFEVGTVDIELAVRAMGAPSTDDGHGGH